MIFLILNLLLHLNRLLNPLKKKLPKAMLIIYGEKQLFLQQS